MVIERNVLQFKRRTHPAYRQVRTNTSDANAREWEQTPLQSKQGFSSLLEEIEEGYFETDLAGNLVSFNEQLCKISGYLRDKLQGMNNREYTDLESAKRMYELFSNTYRTGIAVKAEDIQIIKKDGTKCSLQISASLIRDSEGTPIGFRGIALDITGPKEAEKSLRDREERYRGLFQESREPIIITDRKGEFIDINKAALDLFGYTREEISKASFKDLYTDHRDGVGFQKEMETKGAVQDLEVSLKRKDGTVMTCLLLATAKRKVNGAIIGYQGIVRDITKARATEEALRQREVSTAFEPRPSRYL